MRQELDVLNHNKDLCWTRTEDNRVISSYFKRFVKNLEFLKMLSMNGTGQINRLFNDIYDAVSMISTGKLKQKKRAIFRKLSNLETLQLNYETQEHKQLVDESENFGESEIWNAIRLQIVSIILLLIILSMIFVRLCRKYCQREKLYFTFALKIVSEGNYNYVEICKLYGSLNNYVNTVVGVINNLKVRGYIRPLLEIEWDNLHFIDQGTGTKTEIRKYVGVSWRTGLRLREIFQKDYKINPVFNIKGEIVRIKYQNVLKDTNRVLVCEAQSEEMSSK